jgi:hypothetical protein
VRALVVQDEGFQRAGQDGFAAFVARAGALAELLVRADPPADFWQRAGLVIDPGSLQEQSLLDPSHGCRNIVMGGTGFRTGSRIGAVDAAGRFAYGAFRIKLDDYIVKVADAVHSRAQIQVLKWNLHARLAVDL